MKKVLFTLVVLILGTDLLMAKNPPREVGDVAYRKLSDGPSWIRSLGHVGMHNGNGKMLEVSNHRGAIFTVPISEFTARNIGYYGTRYGKGSSTQRAKGIRAGYTQIRFNPKYTYMPWYTPGKWKYRWKWSLRKGFYKKWIKRSAWFRCDSFVNYCYAKGTGKHLVGNQRQTSPSRVWRRLPHRR